MADQLTIGLLGGTGPQGRGLALRLALAGHRVLLGSRDAVRAAGIVPDLFRERSGVVAEGEFHADGSFKATNLLAKHDEKYMPPQVKGAMHETETLDR